MHYSRRISSVPRLALLLTALSVDASPLTAANEFRAGASAIDITPEKLPVIQNGGFLERTTDTVTDPLHARALVLDDGTSRVAIVIVDSCMIPRALCDRAKSLASAGSAIPPERMLIAATHTHSAPSVMDYCLGTRADPGYSKALPPLIARSIVEAAARLQPARIGWAVADAGEYTNCRRWILRPDKVREDPFGRRTVRAMMHPGYQNPDFVGPAGPIDPALSLLSVQTKDGKPLALLGNFSMHYFGRKGLSADYFGQFSRKIAERIAPGDDLFVGLLSQGTSGDLHWMDYSRPRRRLAIDTYTDSIVDLAAKAYEDIQHLDQAPLSMAEQRILLRRRVPDDERLDWAASLMGDGTTRPRNRPEVYAEQAFYLRDNPEETVVLQALRVGELGVTAIPCEVYGITGLKLKRQSPLTPTFNVELANGAAGYIPPPEQHVLGGYTTWPARTAGLEVQAEPKIVDTVLELLEAVSGRKRQELRDIHGPYAREVLADSPRAYWRLNEMVAPLALDASGNDAHARYEGALAFYLPGPEITLDELSPQRRESRAVHFAGGWLSTELRPQDDYTVELWFWNGLPVDLRDVTGVLLTRGPVQLIVGGRSGRAGRLACGTLRGRTPIAPRTWYHIAFVRRGSGVRVYINGNEKPDIEGELTPEEAAASTLASLSIAGAPGSTSSFEGKIDEVAVYDRALNAEEIAKHFGAARVAGHRLESSPLSPDETLEQTHVRDGFVVELVAAEPLIADPVGIDWGPDGKLWVVEMADYPSGMDASPGPEGPSGTDEDGEPGGRVRFLQDTSGDGRYDHSVVFLEDLRFPTGVMWWEDGVLVTAAPDILYAQDTDGDGRADRREVLYTGFVEGNQQLRLNGLRWGLDNWIHCANGGHNPGHGATNTVRSVRAGVEFALGSRDFRIRPGSGLLDPQSGPSQFGRARDDWGNWYGVQNSFPLWHYVLRDHYMRRNPHVPAPDGRRQLRGGASPRVYPAKPPQKRFHSFHQSGRFTSACGPSIYRDEILFAREAETQHAFTCEPFHNLVQHHVLTNDGVSFTGKRGDDGERDFFASSDRWCRPVMTRTGPDGALWIVDMYRYVIEHPRWLPEAGKEELRPFLRSGDDRGRIYRVYHEGESPRAIPSFEAATAADLVAGLESANGPVRDVAQRLLIKDPTPEAVRLLKRTATASASPLARLHALCTLEGAGQLEPDLLIQALGDSHAGVVRHAVRLAERNGQQHEELTAAIAALAGSSDATVRMQVAATLGEWTTSAAGDSVASIAVRHAQDPWVRAIVVSSLVPHYDRVAEATSKANADTIETLVGPLFAVGLSTERRVPLTTLLARVLKPDRDGFRAWQFRTYGRWLDAIESHTPALDQAPLLGGEPPAMLLKAQGAALLSAARAAVADDSRPEEERIAAAGLLAREPSTMASDLDLLHDLLTPRSSSALHIAAIRRLEGSGSPDAAGHILSGWSSYSPSARAAAADALSSNTQWAIALLRAVETGNVHPATLGAVERGRLLGHQDKAVAGLAKKTLTADGVSPRRAVVEAFRPALKLRGTPSAGEEIFRKTCSACHPVDGEGKTLGPDLRSITDRSDEGLLQSILDPSRRVDPRYLGYNAVLSDGDVVFGLIGAETGNSVILKRTDGTDRPILREAIESLESTGRSFMPDGLEAGWSHQDLANLIEYLRRG